MALEIQCDFCPRSIDEPAALLFSPPMKTVTGDVTLSIVSKLHICAGCYDKIMWLMRQPDFGSLNLEVAKADTARLVDCFKTFFGGHPAATPSGGGTLWTTPAGGPLPEGAKLEPNPNPPDVERAKAFEPTDVSALCNNCRHEFKAFYGKNSEFPDRGKQVWVDFGDHYRESPECKESGVAVSGRTAVENM